jgi:hypothetical protein
MKTIFKIVITWISIESVLFLFFLIFIVAGIEYYQTVWSQDSSKYKQTKLNALVVKFQFTWVFMSI